MFRAFILVLLFLESYLENLLISWAVRDGRFTVYWPDSLGYALVIFWLLICSAPSLEVQSYGMEHRKNRWQTAEHCWGRLRFS